MVWSSKRFLHHTSKFLGEWQQAREIRGRRTIQVGHTTIDNQVWQARATGSWKCNVDDIVFSSGSDGGYGAVIRDAFGTVILILLNKFSECKSFFVVELLSCWNAPQYIVVNVHDPDTLEIDVQWVFVTLSSTNRDDSEFNFIIEDCRTLLKRQSNISLNWVRWQENKLAHKLARTARCYPNFRFWESFAPVNIVMNS